MGKVKYHDFKNTKIVYIKKYFDICEYCNGESKNEENNENIEIIPLNNLTCV